MLRQDPYLPPGVTDDDLEGGRDYDGRLDADVIADANGETVNELQDEWLDDKLNAAKVIEALKEERAGDWEGVARRLRETMHEWMAGEIRQQIDASGAVDARFAGEDE